MPTIFRYYPVNDGRQFPEHAVKAALLFPGVRLVKDGSIEAPLNAAWFAERALVNAGVTYKTWTPKQPVRHRPGSIAELIKHGLRPVDPLTGIAIDDFLLAYQKREPLAFADHEGALFQWPPGAGKSLGGMIWSLFYDGLTVIVTGAKGRLQWRDQLKRYTIFEPVVLTGTEHQGEVELQLLELAKPAKGIKTGRAFPSDIRAQYEGAKVSCSCGTVHRVTVLARGARKLYARVRLPAGHHDLSFTVGNVTSMAVPYSIVEDEIPAGTRFVVCGWETLPWHVDKIMAAKPVSLILDESHRSKSHRRVEMVELSDTEIQHEPKAKQLEDGRWVKYVDLENIVSATQKLSRKAKRRCLLSATPVKDRTRDLWAQLDYAEPFAWGSYWSRDGKMGFAQRYCNAYKNPWGGMDDRGSSNLDELFQRVSYIRSYVSISESHASLPAKRREIVYLGADAQQREDEGFADELAAAAKARASVHSIANIRLAAACSRKRKAVIDEVVEAVNGGANVIVFTARRNDVEVMKSLIPPRLSKECWSYFGHGGDSFEQRDEASKMFMSRPTHSLFCGVGYAFGEQIDLHNADLMILAMLPWTISELIQWEGRGWRLGGRWPRPCLFKYMIAEGTLDERVASILLSKLPAIEKMGTEGVANLRGALSGNEDELLASLAAEIMASGAEQIEGIADD